MSATEERERQSEESTQQREAKTSFLRTGAYQDTRESIRNHQTAAHRERPIGKSNTAATHPSRGPIHSNHNRPTTKLLYCHVISIK